MKKQTLSHMMIRALVLGGIVFAQASTVMANRAGRASAAIWVHDEIYGTIATDTSFKSPPVHSTDVLYNFAESGLTGQRAIAEYAPGDPEYNGGRWNVMAVAFTDEGMDMMDMDGDGVVDEEVTNAEDLEMLEDWGYVTVEETGVYFECPLLPARGGRNRR